MKAVIMAGGAGSRLRPLTANQPKPMVPLANRPLMEHAVLLLKRHGFTDIVVTVQFLASLVRTYFGTGEDLGVEIDYATEETPLGTAGSVRNAEAVLDEPFLVISGDALTDIDLRKVVAFHQERDALVTVVLSRQKDPLEYGIVVTDEDGRIERFLEKPGWGQVFTDTVNTGIYVLDPAVFKDIPEGEPYDFSKELFPKLLERGERLFGYIADGYWTDVGTIEAFRRAQQDALDGKVRIDIPGFEIADRVWVGEGAIIDPSARIEGPALIGEHAKIEAGAVVREYSVLGNNVAVTTNAFLHRTTVYDNAYIGAGANLRGAVVGRRADVRANARLEEGVVLGDDVHIGRGAVVQPNVKIYPSKRVEPGAVITHSIIWESRGARTLFGRRGVSGLVNVDLTPDFAVRLGLAYATTLKRGATVVLSRDASRAARTIKRALIAGLNGAGVHVEDLEVAPIGVTRAQVRSTPARGAIAVGVAPGDPISLDLRFIDAQGADVDEDTQRSIERVFFREDYRRAFPDEIGELRYPPRALELYQSGLLERLDVTAIRDANIKSVIDCTFGPASLIFPALLGRLGSDTLIVNGYVDESTPTLDDTQIGYLRDGLRELVRTSRADLGALLEPDGERLELIGAGGVLIPRAQALVAVADLAAEAAPGRTIVVPASASRTIEAVVEARGGNVIRSARAPSALVRAARQHAAIFAGDETGLYIFTDAVPGVDGIAAFCALHELLARTAGGIAERAERLPIPAVIQTSIPTPFAARGTVMRELSANVRSDRTDDTEGITFFWGTEWALVIPDPEEPVTQIWTEGHDLDRSGELAARMTEYVSNALAEPVR